MRHGQREALLRKPAEIAFEPRRLFLRLCEHDDLVGRPLPQRILDREQRIGVADMRVLRVGRGLFRTALRVGAGIVDRPREQREKRHLRRRSDDVHFRVLARVTAHDGLHVRLRRVRGGHDENLARHGVFISRTGERETWEDRRVTIADLLHEAAETHHVVYRIVDGDDPDWASWYADWLLELSELPELLGRKPVRSHLVHALVQLDRDYVAAGPSERWEDWYAARLPGLV